jgi:hypothetical protein
MTENAPANRVLSGEVIVFQNETHELFKDLINASESPLSLEIQQVEGRPPLKVRYVNTVLLEFLRCALENQIPVQPAQQTMLIRFVLKTREYAFLH